MADRLHIQDDYGTCQSIILMKAKSRRELSRLVKDNNPGHIDTGCGHDCSGRVCGQYATLLRAYRAYGQWVGVVHLSVSIDV
jgi:hypothetical protein